MNRDEIPDPAAVAAGTVKLMTLARRHAQSVPWLSCSPRTVRKVILAAVEPAWDSITPEVARDVMITAAEKVLRAGYTITPDEVSDRTADSLLELTRAHQRPDADRGINPPRAFASSRAFDRDADRETLQTVCVLLALAHIRQLEQEAVIKEQREAGG
ncbi:MAG TPA: hypothetical protein VMV92_39160 [Streptosporangiaceae bacterium]|nr:hypothetical protein [Streptosporangiaceae bacterium]